MLPSKVINVTQISLTGGGEPALWNGTFAILGHLMHVFSLFLEPSRPLRGINNHSLSKIIPRLFDPRAMPINSMQRVSNRMHWRSGKSVRTRFHLSANARHRCLNCKSYDDSFSGL